MKFIYRMLNGVLAGFHRTLAYFKAHTRMRILALSSVAIVLLAFAGLEGWKRWYAEQHDHDERQADVIHRSEGDLARYGVTFAEAAAGKLAVELKVPGEVKLNGDMVAHMIPRFPGIVRQVLKNLGDVVKKGEVLAVFENNANLAPFEMKSQMDGVVIEKNIALGEVIGADDEAFVVADLSQVWVDLFIYPADLVRIKAGQKVRIIDHNSNKEAQGTLSYVAPTISDHTRTALARVILPNQELTWRPGTFITGAIVIDESDVPVLIDGNSLQDIAGIPTIFVKDKEEDGFVATPVRIGRRDDKHVEILEGVAVGARIATSGSFLLKAEMTKGSAEHEH